MLDTIIREKDRAKILKEEVEDSSINCSRTKVRRNSVIKMIGCLLNHGKNDSSKLQKATYTPLQKGTNK